MKSLKSKLVLITAGLIIIIVSVLTYTIVLNATKILRAELNRELSQNVEQGITLFSNFLEWQHVNLGLWNTQPIVKVFFKSPALAALSRSGLESYFSQIRARSPWIVDIWFIDTGTIIYDHANLFDQPSEQSAIPDDLHPLFSQTAPFIMNMNRFYPDQEQWVLVLTLPFSENGTIFTGKYLVLILDLNQINDYLFKSRSIGRHGFLIFVGITPNDRIVSPEQKLRTSERQDFAQMIAQCRNVSDIPESYHSILLTHDTLPNVPITLLGIASRDDIQLPIRELMLTSTFIGGFILLAGLAGAVFFSEKLIAPLKELTEIVREMTGGNVPGSALLENSGLLEKQNELGVLAKTFNMMFMKIQEYTIHLEEKVAQRTQGLELANTRMLQEIEERKQVENDLARNIAEHKRLEDELRHAKDAAEAANQAKSTFLANMSHELRTPLNAVLGYAQILQNAENLTTRQVEALKTIKSSGEHLLRLINDILDLSKIEAGHLELQVSEFHFPEFLDYLAGMIRIRAEQKGLAFVYERTPDLPVGVRADEKKLRQVLLNLLGNAVKFTEQGSVTFRVKRIGRWGDGEMGRTAPHPPIPPSPHHPITPSPHLRFEIEDTGIGIASEKLEEIFLPFQQISKENLPVEGTGLGLAISQKLVTMMGGELHVESPVGQGSLFWFALDFPTIERVVAGVMKQSRKIIGYTGERRTILVVDDNQENRDVLVNMLLPLGFKITEAKNGQECVEKAIKLKPDLILLDLRMPVLDGFEATQRIREFENQNSKVESRKSNVENDDSEFPVSSFQFPVPIIAVSASVFETARKRALSIGFNDFLFKPFQLENLLELLHTYLHMEWIYEEEVEEQPEVKSSILPASQPIVPLPSEEVNVLLKLAEYGNVKRILEQLNHIEGLGKQFLPLLTELRTLAKSFQVDEIVERLEEMQE